MVGDITASPDKECSIKHGNSASLPRNIAVESQRAIGGHVCASTETGSCSRELAVCGPRNEQSEMSNENDNVFATTKSMINEEKRLLELINKHAIKRLGARRKGYICYSNLSTTCHRTTQRMRMTTMKNTRKQRTRCQKFLTVV